MKRKRAGKTDMKRKRATKKADTVDPDHWRKFVWMPGDVVEVLPSDPNYPHEAIAKMDAERDQSLAERVVAGMMEKDAFSRWLGITVVDVRPRSATVQLVIRDDMLNGFELCHGGITYALADSALAFACNTEGRISVSIDNSISYPAPVHAGDVLTAEAREESASNRLAFYKVTVRQQDDVVAAIFRGTVYRTNKQFFPDPG